MKRRQSFPILQVNEIVRATGGTLIRGNPAGNFYGISTDTRRITEGSFFIPLKGERFDGHDFLADALKGGAAGLLVQEGSEDKLPPCNESITIVLVEDTLKALGDIAHFWRRKFTSSVVAITGSSGKTTTKEMISGIVELKKNVIKAQGNFNNLVGVPLTILNLNDQHDVIILEMGTNRRGEIKRLTRIAEPDIGLITNIGPAHLEGLKSLETVRDEKCDLFRNMTTSGVAIVNMDDKALKTSENIWPGKKITFGLGLDADVSAENIIKLGRQGTRFTLRLGEVRQEISLSVAGDHNIYNALAAAASSWAIGIDQPTICRGLTAFRTIPGRMEISQLKNGAFIIDDTYNANPASVREALKTLKDVQGNHQSTVVLGDMLELGDHAEEMHERIGSLIADIGVGTLFLTGRFAKATATGAIKRNMSGNQISFFDNPKEIVAQLKSTLIKGDWILVKGSRMMKMEEIVRAIIEVFGLGAD